MEGIVDFGQPQIGLFGISIEVSGSLHGEGLMGPLGVELCDEGVEALLLLDGVAGRRASGVLLQGEVHALVAPVLLGMTRLDAFDRDAEAEPPYGELGEIEEAVWGSEGQAIVGSDCGWQSAFGEDALEGCNDGQLAGGFEGFAGEQEA